MASRRTYVLGTLALVTGYLAWGVSTAENNDVTPPQQVPIAISGGHAAGHRYTTPSWSITYDYVEASTDSSYINARGIRDAVIFRRGKPYIHMRADHIEVNLATKDFTATGHLHAEQQSHGAVRTFETGTALWTQVSEHLSMPNLIRLQTQGISVDLHGLTFDVPTGSVKVGAIDARLHRLQ